MKSFTKIGFNIEVKGHRFSFNLDSHQRGSEIFVKTNLYRPAELEDNSSGPLASLIMASDSLSEKEEFMKDLNAQVLYINSKKDEQLSVQLLFDACCLACSVHINRYGRLLIVDLLTYMDIFAILYRICFSASQEETIALYRKCVKIIGTSLNQYVQCPGAFGSVMDFNTWARNKGI